MKNIKKLIQSLTVCILMLNVLIPVNAEEEITEMDQALPEAVNSENSAEINVAEEDNYIPVECSYRQKDARTMFRMVNDFRTGDDAWAWNSDNSEKVKYEDLEELTYDYDLEKVAMQRAAELLLSLGHTRPDGSSWMTAYPSYLRNRWYAENIAWGQTSAADAFDTWKEDDVQYWGQGHRRNMLSASAKSIGIACVVYNGYRYWVQEFSGDVVNTRPVSYSEDTVTVECPVRESDCEIRSSFTDSKYQNNPNITLHEGESMTVPEVTASFWYQGYLYENLGKVRTYTSSDTEVLKVESGKITALYYGDAKVNYISTYGSFVGILSLNIHVDGHIHQYGTPSYTWSDDLTTVTAKVKCQTGGEEVTETVDTSYQIISAPTAEKTGKGRLTAAFENRLFSTQTKDIEIPKLLGASGSVTMSTHATSVVYGKTIQLSASVSPAGQTVIWSSSDESVATVDNRGNVKGKSAGFATIKATTFNGTNGLCEVRVLFSDAADSSQYFFEPVYWALDSGITVGAGGPGKFSPGAGCTREQIVTFLWRLNGQPEPSSYPYFSDVSSDDWFYEPISWAASKGITVGLNDGTGRFGVGQTCTREQCVTFLYRAQGSPSVASHTSFSDVGSGDYYYNSISWAASKGITVGLNDGTGRFGVGQKCTRAMIVTFLQRYAKK